MLYEVRAIVGVAVPNLFARPSFVSTLVLALAGTAWLPSAMALELVPGGYGEAQEAPTAAAPVPDERLALGGGGDDAAGMALGFTPRHASGGAADGAAQAGPRFDFAVRGAASAVDQLGLGERASLLYPGGREASGPGLTVGGAMHWHDWSIGGGLGRADFLGSEVDLFSAMLGYGRLNAEIAYGQSDGGPQTEPRDVLMLSTDLAASSWLTLESDLALGSRPDVGRREDESVAVGRLGLRLNF